MAGTGNLILKRGTTTPLTAQNSATISLINGMPAVQIMGLSRPSNSAGSASGPFAYDNYPNRLWVGVEGYGSTSSEAGTGPGGTIGSMPYGLPTGGNNRSLWMGAEIRADTAVYATGDSNSNTPPDSPVVMRADWDNPSDYVLVTQKAIHTWATTTLGAGSMSSFTVSDGSTTTTIVDSDTLTLTGGTGVDTAVSGDTVTFSLDLSELTTEPSPAVGDFLSGVDISNSNVTRNFTIGTALGVLGGDISVTTSTGSATVSATNIKLTATNSTNATHYITFVDAATGNENVRTDTDLTYNPSTNTITTNAMILNGASGLTTEKIGNNNTLEINASGGNGTVIRGSQATVDGSTRPTLTVMPGQLSGTNNQFVNIEGGDLYLGNKIITDGGASTPVNIIFEGTTADGSETTLTVEDPTADRTITLPNASGTVGVLDTSTALTDGRIPYYDTTTRNLLGSSSFSFNDSTTTFTLDGVVNIGNTLGTSNSTVSLLNSTATTINFGGGATTAVNIGNSSGIVAVASDLKIGGGATTKTVQLFEASGNGSQYVGIKSPDSVASSYTLTLPDAPSGTSGYALVASGTSGALTWASTGNASTVSGTEVSDNAEYNLVLGPLALSGGTLGLSIDSSDGITYNPSTDKLTMTGDLAVNGGDITTTSTGTATLFNTNAVTVNIGGGATSGMNIGNASGTVAIAGSASVGGDLAVNGATSADITTTTSEASLFATTATVVRIGTSSTSATTNTGGASTIHLGDDSAVVNIGKTGGSSSLNIRGATGSGSATINTNAPTANVFNANATTLNLGGAATTVNIGSSTATINLGGGSTGATVNVKGNLVVEGTTTTVNSTTLTVDDKNIEIGSVTTPNDATTADGGGITLKGTTDKTLLWNNTSISGTTGVWRSSEHFSIASGKSFTVVDDIVLNKTTLKLYGSTSGNITINPNAITTSYTLSLPAAQGGANTVLTNDGSGNLSWGSSSASTVTVRTESNATTTKYPVPFLGSSSDNNPASSWSGLSADGNTATAYLFTDATNATMQSTPSAPTNSSTGLFYEVGNGTGTLYCDYIGATLDCGSYT